MDETASTGAILLIDSEGNPRRLTSQDLRGTTLSLASIRSMLLNRFGRRGGSGVEQDEDDDDEEVEDFIDEDEMDEDGDWRYALLLNSVLLGLDTDRQLREVQGSSQTMV